MSPYFSWEEIPSGRPLAHTGGPRFKVKYISHRGGLPLEASTLVSSVSGLRARSEATKQTPESKVSPYKMRVKRPPTPCSRSCVAADIEPGRRGATSTKSNKPLTFANPAFLHLNVGEGRSPGCYCCSHPASRRNSLMTDRPRLKTCSGCCSSLAPAARIPPVNVISPVLSSDPHR